MPEFQHTKNNHQTKTPPQILENSLRKELHQLICEKITRRMSKTRLAMPVETVSSLNISNTGALSNFVHNWGGREGHSRSPFPSREIVTFLSPWKLQNILWGRGRRGGGGGVMLQVRGRRWKSVKRKVIAQFHFENGENGWTGSIFFRGERDRKSVV